MADIIIRDYARTALYTGELGEQLADYTDGYICDIITEIADSNVEIYTAALWEWAAGNSNIVEEAVEEFDIDLKASGITGAFQAGQFLANERDIYDNLADSVLYCILLNLDEEAITEEQLEAIECIEWDADSRIEDILDEAEEIINPDEDEDEEF